jgi:hypothetical protein
MATNIVGLSYRTAAVISFMKAVAASDQRGDDWGVELEREPGNQHHANAIAVYGDGRGGGSAGFVQRLLSSAEYTLATSTATWLTASLKRERYSRWPPNCMRSP